MSSSHNYTTLEEYIQSILFKKTKSFASKEELKDTKLHCYYDVEDVIKDPSSKFIKFNTRNITTILIFDIDKFPHFSYQKPPMSEYKAFFTVITGIEPTYIMETDRGYHVGVGIKNRVFTKFKDSGLETANHYNLRIIKKEITGMINADKNASNKICGIYRNPLTHPCIYTGKQYTIEELLYQLSLEYEKPNYYQDETIIKKTPNRQSQISVGCKIRNKNGFIIKSIEEGYHEGNRSNYIYSFLFKSLFENRSLSKEDLYKIYESKIKSSKVQELTEKEIENQIESVLDKKDTMFSGVLKVNKRGKLSNQMWERGIHGKRQRQQYAQKYTAKERTKKTLQLIVDNFHLSLQDMSIKINRSIKTIKRYMKLYNIGVEFIGALSREKIDIRANFFFSLQEIQPITNIPQNISFLLEKKLQNQKKYTINSPPL